MGKYGEPLEIKQEDWHARITGHFPEYDQTFRIHTPPIQHEAYAQRRELLQRLVACANACEGMDDPAAEIERLRKENEEHFNKISRLIAKLTRAYLRIKQLEAENGVNQ